MPATAYPDTDTAPNAIQTVALVSLGCPKNLVDSEKMLGLLAEGGLLPVPAEEDFDGADAVVINTCGFLEASKEESLGEIIRAVEAKREGRVQRVVVAGCLVQRHRAKLLEWAPGVDALIGVYDRDRVLEAVRGGSEPREPGRPGPGSVRTGPDFTTFDADGADGPGEQEETGEETGAETARLAGAERSADRFSLPVYSSIAASATLAGRARGIDMTGAEGAGYFEDDAARLRLTPRHYAYLRISEGCNQNCAFCTIPSIRGKMRSKPLDRILAEARELFADGAFELNLIGQDTTSYGEDIGYRPGLVGLLEALDQVVAENGGGWLRLMYAYPSAFTDAMIDAIARLPRIVKYIDMPLQHINDRVLDAMRRKTSRKLIETLLAKLRDRVQTSGGNIAIRTTFISGFPGETEQEHEELLAFVEDFGFDAMGVFPYSPEPGTPAGRLHIKDAVEPDTIACRIDELMTAQQGVAFRRNDAMVGDAVELDVLIDDEAEGDMEGPGGATVYSGRTYAQAPDVDATTFVASRQPLSPGELVRCRITGYDGYDLVAQPMEDLAPPPLSRRLSILRA